MEPGTVRPQRHPVQRVGRRQYPRLAQDSVLRARASALAVITSSPSVPSATSRKAASLCGVSNTNSTPGRRPPWSRWAQPLRK